MPEPGLDEFSELIGAIYDCALDPQRWQSALLQILDLIRSPNGGLAIHDFVLQRMEKAFDHGYDEEYRTRFLEKYAYMDPITAAMPMFQVGEVFTQAMVVEDEEFLNSRIYREFLCHYELRDAIASVVLRSGPRIAILFGNRRERDPRYGPDEVRLLGLLVPHICR